jgi:hypothetical protein
MRLNDNSGINDVTPLVFYLGQNYPNPFKEKTMIKYCIAYKSRVQIKVYNSAGEEIEKLVDEEKKAGTYEVEFDALNLHSRLSSGRDAKGGKLAAGTYYYRLQAGAYSSEKTMILSKQMFT